MHRKKRLNSSCLIVIGIIFFSSNARAVKPTEKSFLWKPLKAINMKDGINEDEALLIAQHCLNKSPYHEKYFFSRDQLRLHKKDPRAFDVEFIPEKDFIDGCSLSVRIDRRTGDAFCTCQKEGNAFSLQSAFLETEDKQAIHYDHYQKGHKHVIILAHGFYNSKEAVLFIRMAQDLIDEYDVILFDLRGHGLSSGFFTWTAKSYMDLEAVLKYAASRYEKIGLVGFSLGAATSIITAAQSDLVTSLIAVSAPTEFSKIDAKFWSMGIEENIIYNLFEEGRIGKGVRPGLLWLKKIKPIDVVDQINVPMLFLHGEKDWLIDPRHSRELYDKAKGSKRLEIMAEGSHAEYLYRKDPQGTIKIFKEWFQETLGGN